MNQLQRIYKLHRIISSHRRPVPRTTLEKELECSRATVKRIIQEMKLYFNAPLEYDRERNGYFYDTQDGQAFELPGVWFNAAELHALLTTQQLLEQVQPGLLDSHLKPIKERVEKLLAAGQLDEERPQRGVRDDPLVELVVQVVVDREVAEIEVRVADPRCPGRVFRM